MKGCTRDLSCLVLCGTGRNELQCSAELISQPLSTQNTAYLPAPTAIEESIFQYSLEMDNILTNGLLEIGTPWRLATERKTVGIGE